MRAADLLAQGTQALAAAGVPDPGRDARRLLAHALDIPAGRLTLILPDPAPDWAQLAFADLISRRAARAPLSHLTGQRQFYGRDFAVSPDVLDPRPETETLVEAALARPFASVLDLGTGSGCILLTLLAEREGAVGVGTDLSPRALAMAARNRAALGLEDRADLRRGDWFDALDPADAEDGFDLIVSNPPYIAADEMAGLDPEVRMHEPRMALTDGADGLSAYRAIAAGAPAHLAPGGALLVEIGPGQGAAVAAILRGAGFRRVTCLPDMDGRDRVVMAVTGGASAP